MAPLGKLALLLGLVIIGVVTGAPAHVPGPTMDAYPLVTVTEDVP